MLSYRILDTNQRERGRFTAERIFERISDGRSDARTKVQVEGTGEWTELGNLPEFAERLKSDKLPPRISNARAGRKRFKCRARKLA
jgi:hypothetical protein